MKLFFWYKPKIAILNLKLILGIKKYSEAEKRQIIQHFDQIKAIHYTLSKAEIDEAFIKGYGVNSSTILFWKIHLKKYENEEWKGQKTKSKFSNCDWLNRFLNVKKHQFIDHFVYIYLKNFISLLRLFGHQNKKNNGLFDYSMIFGQFAPSIEFFKKKSPG